MTLRSFLWAFTLCGVLAACSSPTPSSSSSSHWLACHDFGDCNGNADAVACTAGYCVDSSGQRLGASHPAGAGGGGSNDTDGGGGGGAPSSGPCDPLAAHMLPVTLGNILGIASDTDGTTYLADEATSPSTTDRVFVSAEANVLERKRITGSGSSGGGADADYDFMFQTGSTTLALFIQRRGGKTTAMGIGPADQKGFIGDPALRMTPLTVLDPGSASSFTFRNLPGDVTIDYVADLDDGNVLVVTHPTDDFDDTDFRTFYGPPTTLVERRIVNIIRSRSGGVDLTFRAGNSQFTAHFTYVLMPAPDGGIIGHPGPGTLDAGGGKTVGFTQRLPTPTTLPGLSFVCL